MQHLARLAILQAVLMGSVAGEVVPCVAQQGAPTRSDEIERLRRALMESDAEAREAAIVALLGRPELEAHTVLQEALGRGGDAANVSEKVLTHLAIALANTSHPVFANAELRAALVRDYAPALVRFFVDDPAATVSPLRERALRALRAMTYVERKGAFEAILQGVDRDLARAAVRAAGGCRDVSTLAPWLFGLTSDPELGAAARTALAELTFVDGGFADEAAFQRWYADNGQRPFVDLAEDAARSGRAALTAARERANAALIQQTARLVAAFVRTESPDWVAVRNEVLAPEPPGRTAACLRALRDAMEPRASGGVRPGGIPQDRLALVDALLARVAAGPSLEEAPVLLETIAYLTVLDDTAQRAAAESELLKGLGSADKEMRLAALRGLRRFPSAANRQAVVQVGLEAMTSRSTDTLTVALQCLRDGAWKLPTAGDTDASDWVTLLRRAMTESDLQLRQRELALDVATLQEGDGSLIPTIFELLVEVVRLPERELSFRKQVVPRLWQFTRDEVRGAEYVRRLLELLSDPEPEMRQLAANQLENLPESGQSRVAEWNRSIVMAAAARLREESERPVMDALADLLLHVSEDSEIATTVVGQLENAAGECASQNGPEVASRREVLVEALRVIGLGRERPLAIWVAAGRGLCALGARDALRQVLERQQIETLAGSGAEGALEAFRLALDAAQMRSARPWSERIVEAREVAHAAAQLETAGEPLTPADQVLHARVLLALGRHDDVVGRANAALASSNGNAVTDADRRDLLLALASAHVARSELDVAAATLQRLESIGTGQQDSEEALRVWTALAEKRLEAGASGPAVEIAERVLAKTSMDAAPWRERFLLAVTARLEADPDSRDAVLDDLRKHESRFQGAEVPTELQARYADLRRRAETGRTVAPGR